jgi:hypothetical protein
MDKIYRPSNMSLLQRYDAILQFTIADDLRACSPRFTIWPCKNISYGRGLQVCERPLMVTHLDQSNYLANQKQGEGNKYNLTVFTGLFQVSLRALKAVSFFSVPAFFQCIHSLWLMNLIEDFLCRVTYWALVEMLLEPLKQVSKPDF